MAHRETGVPGAYDNGGEAPVLLLSDDLDRDLGRIREGVEHRGALLRLGDQRLDLIRGRVGVDFERHLDGVEAVADVGVAENALEVVVALDRRLDRAKLDLAVLGDRRDARREAAASPTSTYSTGVRGPRRRTLPDGRHRRPTRSCALLLAEAEEADRRGCACRSATRGGPPGELGGLRRAGERFPRVDQRLDIDAIVDGGGHRLSRLLCHRVVSRSETKRIHAMTREMEK